jgi:hypothetical protein
MKLKKEWKNISLIMLLFLFLMVIFNLNGNNKKIENFENNPTEYLQLKSELASFVGIPEDRIDNIQIDGVIPDVKITFKVLPRTIDALDEKNLLDVQESIASKIGSMSYDFTVEGETLKFIDINVSNDSIKQNTEYKQLMNKYIDPTINKQIKHLKNIKNYVKYDNSMDRFYKFNDDGALKLNNPISPETEEASLPSIPSMSVSTNNTVVDLSTPSNNTLNNNIESNNIESNNIESNNNVIESFTINDCKPYLKLY